MYGKTRQPPALGTTGEVSAVSQAGIPRFLPDLAWLPLHGPQS